MQFRSVIQTHAELVVANKTLIFLKDMSLQFLSMITRVQFILKTLMLLKMEIDFVQ